MKETSKAMARRIAEGGVWNDIFRGKGIDVGCGNDPLSEWSFGAFSCIDHDLPEGMGDDLGRFIICRRTECFDFIHGSQVLEHALDPKVMLGSWITMLKKGGYIVATVPDWELYEGKTWPSKWSDYHRSTWSMTDYHTDCKLPEWLHQFGLKVVRCKVIDTNYDYTIGASVDQTLDPNKGVEAFIEFVLCK